MRVMLWLDEAYQTIPGGHQVQADRTAEALRGLGVDVTLRVGPDADFDGIDVIHALGPEPAWLRRARERQVPIALTPIYPGRRYVLGLERSMSRSDQIARAVRLGSSAIRRGPVMTARTMTAPLHRLMLMFETADLLLPNSESEAALIREELEVSTPMQVVPNGAQADVFTPPTGASAPRAGVLYVGRVDPHKNQLGLIRAMAGSDVPLTIVGGVHPHHEDYLEQCRREADASVTFVGPLAQEDLVDLYQRAAVHAMPSWFETTGLSSLEAALCGAAVVTTERGFAREYFGEMAHYCDPDDPASIRDAVGRALAGGPSGGLRQHVVDRFTWAHSARATLAGYEQLL